MQEQQKMIQELKAEIDSLKNLKISPKAKKVKTALTPDILKK